MAPADCLQQWVSLSFAQREIEAKLEKKLKETSDLSLNEFYVLYFLSLEPNKSMRIYDLQDKVGLTQSAMSRLVSRMEKKDASGIMRGNCANDKRGVCIKLTASGLEQLKIYQQSVEKVLQENCQIFKFGN